MGINKLHTQKINSPSGGAISALTIVQAPPIIAFAGTNVGVFGWHSDGHWERLPNSPIGIICLVASPDFARDRTLFAGTPQGIFYSWNAGETWQSAKLPLSNSTILTLCCSPQFTDDGILLAGTLEDGVFFSNNRGRTWENRNFGLLDQTIFSFAFSQNFSNDGQVYLGSQGSVYYSYNHARAWKELPIREEALPVISLSIIDTPSSGKLILAGSELNGLFLSTDSGTSWQKAGIPAKSINTILFEKPNRFFAATELGIFQNNDIGNPWVHSCDLPDTLSLSVGENLLLAGTSNDGIWMSKDNQPWQSLTQLPARVFSGITLSSDYSQDKFRILYGVSEGIWLTTDGAQTWNCLNDMIPFQECNQAIFVTKPDHKRSILAASETGLWSSLDQGKSWNCIDDEPSIRLGSSPDGKIILAEFINSSIRYTLDNGNNWGDLVGAWKQGGRVLGLSVTDQGYFYVALLEGIGENVSFWQGEHDRLYEVYRTSAGINPICSIWIPPETTADRPWYTSFNDKVLKFSSRRSGAKVESSLLSQQDKEETIISLVGKQVNDKIILYACTGSRLYYSQDDAKSWLVFHDFGNFRIVNLQILDDGSFIALLLGGEIIRLIP
jgi:photosystem II stability/assembly factor-like uncharacterized protein